MATHDYVIANQGFPAFRADLNDALAAIVSNNSSATAPSPTFAHMIWVDTAADPSILKMRNADNDAWITIGEIDQTGDTFTLTSAVSAPSLTNSGNLTFTGTGNRITGDFSNATVANRVMFQNSVANGNTFVAAIPNGTGTTTLFECVNNSDPTNASRGFFAAVGSTDIRIASVINGTGSYLPMTFYTGGSERMRILTTGGITFNGDTAAANALDDYEEGTWTGTIKGSTTDPTTPVTATGSYTKIGRQVFARISFSSFNTTGAAGNFSISGLPFSSAQAIATGNIMVYDFLTYSGSNLSPYVSGTSIFAYSMASNSFWTPATHNAGSNRFLDLSVTYNV